MDTPSDLITIKLAQRVPGAHAGKLANWLQSGKLRKWTITHADGTRQVDRVSRADVEALVASDDGSDSKQTLPLPPPRPQTAQREAGGTARLGGGNIEPELLGFDIATAIGMTDATKLMRGKRGKAPHRETVRRWCIDGCIAGGERIYLRSVVINGERLTMAEWVNDFTRRRTRAGFQQGATPRGVREVRNAVERARLEIESNSKPKAKE